MEGIRIYVCIVYVVEGPKRKEEKKDAPLPTSTSHFPLDLSLYLREIPQSFPIAR